MFPVLHGPNGEDGTVQGVFETLGLAYVGCGVLASALTRDKGWTKSVLEVAGLPVAPWRRLAAGQEVDSLKDLQPPIFVKPARAGSSIGVSRVADLGELAAAIELARMYGSNVIVEQGLDARDVECGVLGTPGGRPAEVSVPGETIPGPGHKWLNYAAKYLDDSVQLLAPAPLGPTLTEEAQSLATRAFDLLDCYGLARVDMLLTRDGRLLVNEVTTMPGFTEVSNFPRMWQVSGLDPVSLVDRLVLLAQERHARRNRENVSDGA